MIEHWLIIFQIQIGNSRVPSRSITNITLNHLSNITRRWKVTSIISYFAYACICNAKIDKNTSLIHRTKSKRYGDIQLNSWLASMLFRTICVLVCFLEQYESLYLIVKTEIKENGFLLHQWHKFWDLGQIILMEFIFFDFSYLEVVHIF